MPLSQQSCAAHTGTQICDHCAECMEGLAALTEEDEPEEDVGGGGE